MRPALKLLNFSTVADLVDLKCKHGQTVADLEFLSRVFPKKNSPFKYSSSSSQQHRLTVHVVQMKDIL